MVVCPLCLWVEEAEHMHANMLGKEEVGGGG
jgi:hypothetical protein